jgi:hypothetical protein
MIACVHGCYESYGDSDEAATGSIEMSLVSMPSRKLQNIKEGREVVVAE